MRVLYKVDQLVSQDVHSRIEVNHDDLFPGMCYQCFCIDHDRNSVDPAQVGVTEVVDRRRINIRIECLGEFFDATWVGLFYHLQLVWFDQPQTV